MSVSIKPIGVVHVDFSDDEIRAYWGEGVEGVIEVYEEYAEGLNGIEGFSHLIVIAYFNRVSDEQREVLRVKPKRLKMLGFCDEELPEVGVFCTDSPHRPNPIGLTITELSERKGRFLKVKHLDLFDKTPVLDIKPYTPSRIIQKIKLPEWYQKIIEKARTRHPQVRDF
jgi:tRNA-Thr(GGU) m(6)t(6)A37 methyltransferase TsaA